MKYSWKNDEIKNLIKTVENYKNQNKSLLDAFIFHASQYKRQPLSVRNFYYSNIDNIKKDELLKQKFDMNLKLHEKNNYSKFDARQTKKLLDYIKKSRENGESVRRACQRLANNDATLMVRYQNKYRELTKNENLKNNNILKIADNKRQNNNETKSKAVIDNVINFPMANKQTYQKLSDEEIKSLFMGLVRLVKKSAFQELEDDIKEKTEKQNLVVRKSIVEINQKSEKINELLNENKKLSKQIVDLKSKLIELRTSYNEK